MSEYAELNKKFAAQLPKNISANLVYYVISLFIGILITPYFVSTLGVAAYGIIPLATSMVGYVGLVITSLDGAVTRYLTVDLQKEDFEAANVTFNTAMFGYSAMVIIMMPIIVILSFLAPYIFNAPAGQETAVIILFFSVFSASLIRTWCGGYSVQLFAYNRIDLQNVVNIINLVVQYGLIFLFFTVFKPDLTYVAIAILAGSVSSSLAAVMFAKELCPHLRISIKSINRSKLKDLSSLSWWVIIDQICTLLLLQIDLIVVNLLFGTAPAGEYAIVLQMVVILRGATNAIYSVLSPMFIGYYAKGYFEMLIKMVTSSTKLLGLLIALPIGFICGFAPDILSLWVGGKFTFLSSLVIVMVLPLVINLTVIPLFAVNFTYNKMRVNGLLSLALGIINVFSSIALPLITGWGYYAVALSGISLQVIKNISFTPWYASKLLCIKMSDIINAMIPGIMAAIVLVVISAVIRSLIQINSIPILFVVGCIISLIYALLVWRCALSSFERNFFKSYLPEKLKNIL